MVNPFLNCREELEELVKTSQEIREAYMQRIRKIEREMHQTIELIQLRIKAIEDTCTHQDEKGQYDIRINYDPAGGRSEHTCNLCGERTK